MDPFLPSAAKFAVMRNAASFNDKIRPTVTGQPFRTFGLG
jgi:hypothetical protein